MRERYEKAMRPDSLDVKLEMKLILMLNQRPFYFNSRRLSYTEKIAVAEIIQDLLIRKIIRPSTSQYSSLIVLVRKKNGQIRMTVDYRELNKITLEDHFPIPRIEDQIDCLRGKKYFTQLDLKNTFHHIKLEESSIQYTSFVTFMGQYEFTHMPFGLSNGPSFFMRYIYAVFRPLIEKGEVLIYLDDILIATIDENLTILE